jgi:hypothetical protein
VGEVPPSSAQGSTSRRPPTAGSDDVEVGAHGELKLCRRPQDLVANTSPTTTGSMSSSSAHCRSTGWGGHLLVSLVSPFWTARGEHVGYGVALLPFVLGSPRMSQPHPCLHN